MRWISWCKLPSTEAQTFMLSVNKIHSRTLLHVQLWRASVAQSPPRMHSQSSEENPIFDRVLF